jgi:hypothetical protein
MKPDDRNLRDALAAEYVLGTLAGAARARFERLLARDPDLADHVRAWEQRLGALVAALPPVPPPDRVRRAIEARLDRDEIEDGVIIRRGDGAWRLVAPGVDCKILRRDAAGGGSALYRLAPGAGLPAHEHPRDEECYIVHGSLQVGGTLLGAGDYFTVSRGGYHGTIRSPAGALLLIRGEVA